MADKNSWFSKWVILFKVSLTMQTLTISLDHIAIITDNIPQLKRVLHLLNLLDAGQEAVPSQGVITHFVETPGMDAKIEILEPLPDQATNPENVVNKFLAKKGCGVHHLSFIVKDIYTMSQRLTQAGVRLIYSDPKPGAHNTLVNFLHPASTGGILIEIAQKNTPQ